MNQDLHIRDHAPLAVSKAKRGTSGGSSSLAWRWCLRARVGLHLHEVSVAWMVSPVILVLVWGMSKLI